MPKSKDTIEFHKALEINREAEEQKKQDKIDFEQNLSDASEEVHQRMEEAPFSYNDIEEIMLGYGLEMDYIEEILFDLI